MYSFCSIKIRIRIFVLGAVFCFPKTAAGSMGKLPARLSKILEIILETVYIRPLVPETCIKLSGLFMWGNFSVLFVYNYLRGDCMNLPEPVKKVLETLENAGYEAYLVGGCVRDFLLGKQPKDYDIATSARPEQVLKLFDHTAQTGIAHGTVLVIEDGMPIEVTTFRKDGEYEDHRHPKEVEFVDDLLEDLKRRDFTINAMAWNPKTGLVDPFNGKKDLDDKIIRAVGDPEKRFEEDALRMIRAWRFAARLGFEIEKDTKKAIKDKERLIDDVAVERIVPELEEILQTDPLVLDQMTGLLSKRIPELQIMLETEQNNPHHYTDVLHHTLDAVKFSPSKDLDVLWALLLHDTGKPATKTTDHNGDHFKKHPMESVKIARRVLKDMKMPRSRQNNVPALVLHHDSFYAPRLKNIYKLRVEKGWDDDLVQKLFDVQVGDILAHTDHERMETLDTFRDFYNNEKENRPLSFKDLNINGNDILEHSGLKGKDIQKALSRLLEHMFYHPEDNTKEKALELLPDIEKKIVREKNQKNYSTVRAGTGDKYRYKHDKKQDS